jgi:hypothetical protein
MVQSRFCPKELNIEHVRQPRKWMPIAGVKRAERPAHVWPRQTAEGVWIVRNVLGIIVENEITPQHRPKNKQHGACQPRAA